MNLPPCKRRSLPPSCAWCRQPARLACDGERGGGPCRAVFCGRHGVGLTQSKHLCVDCAGAAGRWRE